MARVSRPTFLGIGAQRAGTTRLHKLLAQHPDIKLPTSGADPFNKEVHFFDDRVLVEDLNWYLRQFELGEAEAHKSVIGEITPAYAILDDAVVSRIRRFIPDLKIVLIIRYPVDRIWSATLMRLADWGRRQLTELPSLLRLVALVDSPGGEQRTDYLRTIRIWQRAFGEDAVHVVLFDDMVESPERTLAGVLSHIGARTDWSPTEARSSEKVWEAPAVACPTFIRYYLARRWRRRTRELNAFLGGNRLDAWIRRLDADSRPQSFGFVASFAAFRLITFPRRVCKTIAARRRMRRIAARLEQLLSS